MSSSPGQPIPPSTSEIAAGRRAACIAYRRVHRTGQLHGPAFREALLALRAVRPELMERQAAEQTTDAIYYASYAHPVWLWRRVGEGIGRNGEAIPAAEKHAD
jgi:hypothetical protein